MATQKQNSPIQVGQGRIYVNAGFNNTIVTITDKDGKVIGLSLIHI